MIKTQILFHLWFVLFVITNDFAFSEDQEGNIKKGIVDEPMHCATCEYLREQNERIRQGKKPIINPSIVPADYWDHDESVNRHGVWDWPRAYVHVTKDRSDSDGNGLRECRYRFRFDDFVNDGFYSRQMMEDFKNEFRLCVDLYNQILMKLGLEFKETTGNDYHLLIEGTTSTDLGSGTGVATLFGAWNASAPICQFRSTYSRFGALSHLLDNGAPFADIKHPMGNPYVYVFPREQFEDSVNNTTYFPIRRTMLHEIGHLLGLRHPFESLYDARQNLSSDYLIDWLARDTVTNPPPAQRSTKLGGEDFDKTFWSRGFMNTYMTYDDEPRFALYPDIPPPIKAYIAHYYGIFDQASAQPILDDALHEHELYSPLANGAILEAEPNENVDSYTRLNIGQPVLGAFSYSNPNDAQGLETYQDTWDGYLFKVVSQDVGRTIDITLNFASTRYEGFYYIERGFEYDGDCMIVVNDPDGNFVAESSVDEFPSLSFTPSKEGIYQLIVRNPRNAEHQTYKDYYLTVEYADGNPSNAPTLTPTPTSQISDPLITPSPIQLKVELDLQILEVYIVMDDGGESFDDDVRIENPAVGQSVRFVAKIQNNGTEVFSDYGFEVYVDGNLFTQHSDNSSLSPNWNTRWRTQEWSSTQEGFHTVEWIFTLAGDGFLSNNRMTLQFPVGEVNDTPTPTPIVVPTSTFTPTETPTRTPTIAASVTPTPVLEPTSTPTNIQPTAAPKSGTVQVYDDVLNRVDLTGQTDFDDLNNAGLTIAWEMDSTHATGWDVYFRKGFGGPKFLARINDPNASQLVWEKNSSDVTIQYQNGPDFNAAYTFRVIRRDDQLSPDDFADQNGFVGLNLEGGTPLTLAQPDLPNLEPGEVVVYDDILGGNNLAAEVFTQAGLDTDRFNWRALQIAWNFNVDASAVMDYRVLIRESEEDEFSFLGQTNNGNITYFWWTQNEDFNTTQEYNQGPQDGKTYQFRIVMIKFNGERNVLSSGWIRYQVSEE